MDTSESYCILRCKMDSRPLAPVSLVVEMVSASQARLLWTEPAAPSRPGPTSNLVTLSGLGPGAAAVRELVVRDGQTCQLEKLPPATLLEASVQTVAECEQLQARSSVVRVQFCSLPAPPAGLALEASTPASLALSWQPPSGPVCHTSYSLTVCCPALQFTVTHSAPPDSTTFLLSRLPQSGQTYQVTANLAANLSAALTKVRLSCSATPAGADTAVISDTVTGLFTTRPLPPTNIKIKTNNEIVFRKSATKTVM